MKPRTALPAPTATGAADFDCRTCAACCAAELKLPFYVGLEPIDAERLSPRWRERNTARASILTKLDSTGRCVCVALRGTVGRRASCSIYQRRPDACRELLAGSRDCLRAREQAGLPTSDLADQPRRAP